MMNIRRDDSLILPTQLSPYNTIHYIKTYWHVEHTLRQFENLIITLYKYRLTYGDTKGRRIAHHTNHKNLMGIKLFTFG